MVKKDIVLSEEEFNKLFDDILFLQKPFGKWKNFNDCTKYMRNQGYKGENAKRICGALQAREEKGMATNDKVGGKDNKIDKQEFGTINDIETELKDIGKALEQVRKRLKGDK